MWGIGIFCLFLLLLVQLAIIDVVPVVEAASTKDETRLMVSFRKESLEKVPSCVHAFSQVELRNMDESEPIVIHSVERTEEEVTNRLTREKVTDTLPEQIRISAYLSEVTLGPKQAAIIPISFLPRFPETGLSVEGEPWEVAAASIAESRGSSATNASRRNNLGYQANADEFHVQIMLLLDTSRGVLQLPIEASSVRHNEYRLPDVIHFPESTPTVGEPSDSPTISEAASTNKGGSQADECFDVHLSNPSDQKRLQIFDVVLSRPDLLRLNVDGKEVSDTALTELFKNWDDDGWQRSIAPGVSDEYVITLCRRQAGDYASEEVPRNNGGLPGTSDLNDGLGYLQIRTDSNMLVVNLDQSANGGFNASPNVLVRNLVVTDVTEPNVLSKQTIAEQGKLIAAAETCQPQSKAADAEMASRVKAIPKNLSINMTDAPHIDIQLVPYVSPNFIKTIELRNTSPYAIKVLQTSLALDFAGDPFLLEVAKEIGLKIDARIGKRNAAMVTSDPDVMDEVVILTCNVQSSSSRLDSNMPLRFSGIVHISAETVDGDQPAQLTMVFPFVVNVMDRQVHVVIDPSSSKVPSSWKHETEISGGLKSLNGLFYPLSRSEASRRGSESMCRSESIGDVISYRLGIVSPLDRPLAVGKIKVVEAADEEKTNLCHRFMLSSFDTLSKPVQVGNSSLFNLGKVTLSYRIGQEPRKRRISCRGKDGMAIDDGNVLPETCHLQVMADSVDGGKTTIPLIVFSGKLDVTSSAYDSLSLSNGKLLSDKAVTAPSAITGYKQILNLLKSSAIWSALDRLLLSLFGDRTSDEEVMFAAYLAGLSTNPLSTGRSLWPLLLNAGSAVHDEVQTFPLYLTNHNPVPVEVSTEVGEVEGMSIALAREYSPRKGDGSGLMDRLPSEGSVKSEKVTKGKWKGHSRRGLHNFLLKSSGFPQTVSSNLQYRDDVSLSPAATEIQPILGSLFTKTDVGYFHAEPLPPDLRSTEASGCPGLDLNPPGYSNSEPRVNGTYPMILSDSFSISRRLSVCRDAATRDNHVSIPPGGVARFEVKLRCPSRRVLDSDITHFLSTGLVLSTDYGQVMPIVANFEALLGHLQISSVNSFDENEMSSKFSYEVEESVIDVSAGLFLSPGSSEMAIKDTWNQTTVKSRIVRLNESDLQGESERMPLFVTSTFSREVAISKVGSCNPWFDVTLLGHGTKSETPKIDTGEKMEIGTVGSRIPCRPFHYSGGSDEFRLDFPDEVPAFPSFYECALDWLQNRYKLQPRGCGLSRNATVGFNGEDDAAADETISTLAVEVLKRVVHYSLVHFNGGYRRSVDAPPVPTSSKRKKETNGIELLTATQRESSYVPRGVVDLFAQMNSAWNLVTRSGMNIVSGNLRAQIDYSRDNSTMALDARKSTTLSVEMSEVAIRTSLEIPTLVDQNRSQCLTMTIDGSELSVLQFPLTRVADVSSLTIPLQNPTPVPIRVRLASFADSYQGDLDNRYDDIGFKFVPSDVHDGYLHRYSPVYVQNEKIMDQPNRGDAQHWWEGGGAFVLPDDRGDIIQARHNLSITAGPSAKISLLNPSLHTFNGFSMGCGTRCGIREDPGQGNNGMVEQQHQLSMKQYSPIGASSASGVVLLGRPRPETFSSKQDDFTVAAGGSTPADPTHAAFAIPYSSLGEIMVPPFGTAELGPILFRPPGRHTTLGCSAAIESQGSNSDGPFRRGCESEPFQSLVFLENSLTGLERLVVSGRGAWENVVFLDPEPFGDIEYRYGRSTLVFPGSAVSESSLAGSSAGPVRKEVVVHNNGDVPVEFGSVYLARSPHLRLNSPVLPRSLEWNGRRKEKELHLATDVERLCHLRGFRLLGCVDSEDDQTDFDWTRNIEEGHVLDPGQNISLFVEHTPDCAFNTDYVTLNLEYRGEVGNQTSWSSGLSSSRHGAVPRREGKVKMRKLELLVGFEMSAQEMASCVPIGSFESRNERDHKSRFPRSASQGMNATESFERQPSSGSRLSFSAVRMVLLCSSALVAACVWKQHIVRDVACLFFQSSLRGVVNLSGASSGASPQPADESDWSAAFRCLARADPSSSELQAMGREQARQLVLGRYKGIGVMAPQCISTTGVLLRDRSGVIGAGGRGSGVINGNERRARTLSDAMFNGAFTDQGSASDIDQMLPCSLGWRAAGSKGLVRKPSYASKSKAVLVRRNAGRENGPESPSRRVQIDAEEPEIAHEDEPMVTESDDHKGDVISTSESEGTTGALREAENPIEEDFAGFAKVSSQKGKNATRDRKKKRQQELNVPSPSSSERSRTSRSQKETTTDSSNASASKEEVDLKTKLNQVASPQAQVQRAKDVASGVQSQVTRLAQQKSKNVAAAVTKKETIRAKAKKSKAAAPVPPPPIDERTIGVVNSPVAMRSLSSTCSSAQSSPSSVGQVSVSSRSTTRSDDRMHLREQPEHGKRSGMRPPPGLAPPPGFASPGSENESLDQTGSIEGVVLPPVVPSLATHNEPSISLAGGGNSDFSSLVGSSLSSSGAENNMGTPLIPTAKTRPPVASSSPLLASQPSVLKSADAEFSNGFDVMDFLDNILGDADTSNKEESGGGALGGLLGEKTTSASIAAMPVSSDPWATERKSRAAAYGIHVEEDEGNGNEDVVYSMLTSASSTAHNRTNGESSASSSLHNSVPLLTPSAMLAANQVGSKMGDGDEETSAFRRGSFYSSLLNEK